MIAFASTATTSWTYWWQGSLMTIKARAADTGGALGLVEAASRRVWTTAARPSPRGRGDARARRRDPLSARHGEVRRWPRHSGLGAEKCHTSVRGAIPQRPGAGDPLSRGLEQMFIDGGVPVVKHPNHRPRRPTQTLPEPWRKFGFDVIGPQLTLVMWLRNLGTKVAVYGSSWTAAPTCFASP